MKQTGSVDLRVNQRGRKAKLTWQDLDVVNDLVNKQPDLSIREIRERLHLNACEDACEETVRKYRVKKKRIHASEQERSRCKGETTPLERTHAESSD